MSEAITLDLARKAIAAARKRQERAAAPLYRFSLSPAVVLWAGAFGAMLDLLEESMLMSPKSASRFWALLTPASRDALSALAESLDRADPGWRER